MNSQRPSDITNDTKLAVWIQEINDTNKGVMEKMSTMLDRIENIDRSIAKISQERVLFVTRKEWDIEKKDRDDKYNQRSEEIDSINTRIEDIEDTIKRYVIVGSTILSVVTPIASLIFYAVWNWVLHRFGW